MLKLLTEKGGKEGAHIAVYDRQRHAKHVALLIKKLCCRHVVLGRIRCIRIMRRFVKMGSHKNDRLDFLSKQRFCERMTGWVRG